MKSLYATATGCTGLQDITVDTSHNNSSSTASIITINTTLAIGDSISIDLGYSDNHAVVFTGYVRRLIKKVPDNVWEIQATDVMSRAVDYFIVPSNPADIYSRSNIAAEDLVSELLNMANLTSQDLQDTNFTMGVTNPVEISNTSVYDYCNDVADVLTFHLWATSDGVVHFRNRKPFVMSGSEPQPGWENDVSVGNIGAVTGEILSALYTVSVEDLRNRVVVYGYDNSYAEASEYSPYLPNLPGQPFYKTVLVAIPQMLPDDGVLQDIADYNLYLLKRLTYGLELETIGNPDYEALTVRTVTVSGLAISAENWYINQCTHKWGKAGYTNALVLNK